MRITCPICLNTFDEPEYGAPFTQQDAEDFLQILVVMHLQDVHRIPRKKAFGVFRGLRNEAFFSSS